MAAEPLPLRLGALLRRIRDDLGLSQERLADRAGVHPTYVGMVERAERNITVARLARLLDALGVTLPEFFTRLEQEGEQKTP